MSDTTIEKIVYKLESQVDQAVAGFEKVDKEIKQVDYSINTSSKSVSNLSAVFKKAFIGVAAAISIAAIVQKLEAISKTSIQLASDVQEMQSKFEAVFQETKDEAKDWSRSFSTEVGRSIYDIQDYMASFQDTFVPLGFTREQGEDFSEQLTQLTVDMASFYNTAESDTLADLQSAIVGNHETVRKYGIIITQAALDQELLNMGIEGGVENATEQEKVLARLNIIMNGTADAQGDAARTANSFANQTRMLKGKLDEVMVSAGNDAMNDLTDTIIQFNEWGTSGGYDDMTQGLGDIASALATIVDFGSKATQVFVDLYSVGRDVVSPNVLELPEGMTANEEVSPTGGTVSIIPDILNLPEKEQFQLLQQIASHGFVIRDAENEKTKEIETQNEELAEQNSLLQEAADISSEMPSYAGKRASYAQILGVNTAASAGLKGWYDSSGIPTAVIPATQAIPAANTAVPTQTSASTVQQSGTSQESSIKTTLENALSDIKDQFIEALKQEPRDVKIEAVYTINNNSDVKHLETTTMKAISLGVQNTGEVV